MQRSVPSTQFGIQNIYSTDHAHCCSTSEEGWLAFRSLLQQRQGVPGSHNTHFTVEQDAKHRLHHMYQWSKSLIIFRTKFPGWREREAYSNNIRVLYSTVRLCLHANCPWWYVRFLTCFVVERSVNPPVMPTITASSEYLAHDAETCRSHHLVDRESTRYHLGFRKQQYCIVPLYGEQRDCEGTCEEHLKGVKSPSLSDLMSHIVTSCLVQRGLLSLNHALRPSVNRTRRTVLLHQASPEKERLLTFETTVPRNYLLKTPDHDIQRL